LQEVGAWLLLAAAAAAAAALLCQGFAEVAQFGY